MSKLLSEMTWEEVKQERLAFALRRCLNAWHQSNEQILETTKGTWVRFWVAFKLTVEDDLRLLMQPWR